MAFKARFSSNIFSILILSSSPLKAKLEAEKREMGMLAICAGAGLEEIFKDLLCDRIIKGGQTMNPSAQDIADAVQKINASNVFVFPNNSNVILAAEQAKGLVTNRTIHVIPTKNVPQGFAAALARLRRNRELSFRARRF